MSQKYDMTIGGRRVGADRYQEIRNPANGNVVGLCPMGTEDHLEQAIAAASKAFATWRNSDDAARSGACQAIAKVLGDNAPELSVLLTKEQGKPRKGLGSEFELGGCAACAGFTATQSLPVKVLEENRRLLNEVLAGISAPNGILKISHYVNLALYEGETFGRDLVIRGSLQRLTTMVSPVWSPMRMLKGEVLPAQVLIEF